MVEFVEIGKAISAEEKLLKARSIFCVPVIYFYNNCVFRYVEELKPFHRGKIEIIEINNHDLNESEFQVKVLGRGATWLTAGMHKACNRLSRLHSQWKRDRA